MSFKIAVIGCGWISMSSHGPAYASYAASHGWVELAACCDVDAARAELFQRQFGFKRSYSDYAELLEKEKPDVVCLNVPVHLISPIGCRILQAGYPLLAEKPPGLSLPEIDHLIAAAEPGAAHPDGVPHQVAFNRRFAPLVTELKKLLNGQEIQHLHYQLARVARMDPDFTTTAIHAIDAARFLMGCDYKTVAFHYQPLSSLNPPVTNFYLDCTFGSGAAAQISICPVSGASIERAIIHCTDNSFFLNCNQGSDAPGSLQQYHKAKLVWAASGEELSQTREDYILNGFYAEDAAFFDAVQAGRQPENDFRSSRQSVEIMVCMRERRLKYEI